MPEWAHSGSEDREVSDHLISGLSSDEQLQSLFVAQLTQKVLLGSGWSWAAWGHRGLLGLGACFGDNLETWGL